MPRKLTIWLALAVIGASGGIYYFLNAKQTREAELLAQSLTATVPTQTNSREPGAGSTARAQVLTILDRDVPPSPYSQKSRDRFAGLLAGKASGMLMSPCTSQVGVSLDSAERSLISRLLARRIAERGEVEVVDPDLSARALGEGRRLIPLDEIRQLAARIGAKEIVTCSVRYLRDEVTVPGTIKMTLSASFVRYTRQGDSFAVMASKDIMPIEFTDERLPYMVLDDAAAEILAALGFSGQGTRTASPGDDMATSSKDSSPAFPASPADLLSPESSNPEKSLERLLFVGSLYPGVPGAGRERVFVKALLAAYALPAQNQVRSYSIARALFGLGRRPAALAVLGTESTAQARALRAALDGNLPALEAAVAEIPDGVVKMQAEFDLFDLRREYRTITDKEASLEISELIKPFPRWQPLLKGRFQQGDGWAMLTPGSLKQSLDTLFPVAGYSLHDLVAGGMVLNKGQDTDVDFELAVLRHIDKLVSLNPGDWCCKRLEGIDSWDLLDLYQSVAEAEIVKRVEFLTILQGRPDAGMALLDTVNPTFQGQPDFARLRAEAAAGLARDRDEPERGELLRVASEAVRDSILWSPGQSWSGALALSLLDRQNVPNPFQDSFVFSLLVNEFPIDPRWPSWSDGGAPDVMERTYQRRMNYATSQFWVVDEFLQFLAVQGVSAEDRATVVKSLEDRFVGSGDKTLLEAESKLVQNDQAGAIETLRKASELRSPQWELYSLLGKTLFERGEHESADEAMRRFPGFEAGTTESRVALSHAAEEAGSMFFWRGMPKQARAFFALAAGYGSGSESDMISRIRLALLDQRFDEATGLSLARANRYSSVYAYRDYLSLLFAHGLRDEAWAGFQTLATSFENPQVWSAADVGARIEARTDEQFREWLQRPEIRNARRGNYSIAARHLILHFVVDRELPSDFADLVSSIEGDLPTNLSGDGKYVTRSSGNDASGKPIFEILGPSRYKGYSESLRTGRASLPLSDESAQGPESNAKAIPSELVMFAEGYSALQRGDIAGAAATFEKFARYYEPADPELLWTLPYFAAAIAPTKERAAVKDYLDKFSTADRRFDWHIAEAFVSAAENHVEDALSHMDMALDKRPHTDLRPIFTQYQWVEACELLWKRTGADGFKARLLQWAQSISATEPYIAWPYAVVAQYGKPGAERDEALGMALYLDPLSVRLKKIPAADKVRAKKLFDAHNPFEWAEDAPQGNGA